MKIERVPVRIQLWTRDGVRVDVRGWMDEFTANNEIAGPFPYTGGNTYEPTGRHDFTVKAHTDWSDKSWKFHRGKPLIEDEASR